MDEMEMLMVEMKDMKDDQWVVLRGELMVGWKDSLSVEEMVYEKVV